MLAHMTTTKFSRRDELLLKEVGAGRSDPYHFADRDFLRKVLPRILLTEVANLRDETGISRLWRQYWRNCLELARFGGNDPKRSQELLELRDELREVWRSPDRSQQILNRWLNWRPSRDSLRLSYALRGLRAPGARASRGNRDLSAGALIESELDHATEYMPFRCSTLEHKLVPNHESLRANLIQGVFEHSRHFRFCANPQCAAPYFIAMRSDQTICDAGDCKAQKQRAHALKWWRANRGKKSDINEKKERLENGTSKAR
jgi:hypothetical protein